LFGGAYREKKQKREERGEKRRDSHIKGDRNGDVICTG